MHIRQSTDCRLKTFHSSTYLLFIITTFINRDQIFSKHCITSMRSIWLEGKVSTWQKNSKEHSIKVLKFMWKTLRVFPKSCSFSFSTLIPSYSHAEDVSYILSSSEGWIWKHHLCRECMMAIQDSESA